jgi:hypothetical protein
VRGVVWCGVGVGVGGGVGVCVCVCVFATQVMCNIYKFIRQC